MSKRRYLRLRDDTRDGLDSMETAVAGTYVYGGTHDSDHEALRAWGVWVRPRRDEGSRGPKGQHGVLGTSAGLELMASTRKFRDNVADQDRRDLIVGSWLYLSDKLAVHPTPEPDSSGSAGPAEPAGASSPADARGRLVVRQGQVLRALSALEHHLTAVIHGSEAAEPLRANRQLAEDVLSELRKCRVEEIPVREFPALAVVAEGAEAVPGYKYLSNASGSDGDVETLPERPIEWAYLWGSVLVGLSRAYQAYFLSAERFGTYVTKDDVRRLARWARNAVQSDNPDELRVGLFAGWSILQLHLLFDPDPDRVLGDLHTGGTDRSVDSAVHDVDLALPQRERDLLEDALSDGAREVINHPSLQPDLHHPYSFHIEVEDGQDPYRQDHLVVPTVPIALWLKARLDGRALFDPRFEKLTRKVMACFDQPDEPKVAPGQSSTYNGTVNMNYLHEAIAEVHDLAKRTAEQSAAWRVAAASRRPYPWWERVSNSSEITFGTALLIGLFGLIASPFIGYGWREVGALPSDDGGTAATVELVTPNGSTPDAHQSVPVRAGQATTIWILRRQGDVPAQPEGRPRRQPPVESPR